MKNSVHAQSLGKDYYTTGRNSILTDIFKSMLGAEPKLFSLDTDKQWNDIIPRVISLIETELINRDIDRDIDLKKLHELFKESINLFNKGRFDKFDKFIQKYQQKLTEEKEVQQKLTEEKEVQQKLKEEREAQKKLKEEKKLEHDYDDTDWESLFWNS